MKATGETYETIAKTLGRTRKATELKADHLPKSEPVVVDPQEKFRADYWRKRAGEMERALKEAQQSKTAVEVLCEHVLEMAPVSYNPAPNIIRDCALRSSHSSPQSAVLAFSDTHIGAVVKPDQTLGMGNYNFEIFLRRLKRLETSVMSITNDHTTTPIAELVVPILGDMLDGALTHSAESGQPNTILTQFYSGGHAIAQFLRNLSVVAPLRLYGCVGNHTRWQNQHRMPSKNRNSNYDMLLYMFVQALTRDIPGIQWNLDWQPFAVFDVQGYTIYCGHGDNLRGGDKALGIPSHSMGRMVSTTSQLFTRNGKSAPNYYLVGHLHRPISIPHSRGEVIVNGAFPGIDGYALGEYFNSSFPSQKFWLMHPKFGRSATYDLRLDLGDETPHGYTLPAEFTCE
jgi:hypothetical protein